MENVLIKSLLLGAALAVATPALFAQAAPITQFVTPTVYKTLAQDAREKYVAGVLDAESSLLPQGFAAIRPCLKGADIAVLTAAVDRFMVGQAAHSNDMPLDVHNAIAGSCKQF